MAVRWSQPDREEALRQAVAASKGIADVCRALGLRPTGGNYHTIKHHIVRLGLDTSHHTGRAWNRDTYREPDQVFNKKSIRRSLIHKYGAKCWQCGLSSWQGEPIPLELDHINGERNDNRVENLRILCCNCHALTPTFRNRKRHAPVV